MAKEDEQGHMRFLASVCTHDVEILVEKEAKYKGSWKKRGGVGAFMMLARKWDRIESQLIQENFDIFKLCQDDKDFRENEIGDLRRYLMLVEAELLNLEKIYPDVTAKLEVKDYSGDLHQCGGKCPCCGFFPDKCFCPGHMGECTKEAKKE